jgi:hypothetical protein
MIHLTVYSQEAKRSLTHLVVASSIIQWIATCSPGSTVQTNIKSMLQAVTAAMTRGNVFIPSPFRLLRYFAENTCEFCNINRASYISARIYAVFACNDCYRTKQSTISATAAPALYSIIQRRMKRERTPPISCMVQFSSSNDYLATYYMWTTKLLLNNVRIGPILSLQEAITITTDSTTSVRRGLLLHRFKTSAPTKENYKGIIDIYDNASTVSKSLTMTS